MYFDFSVCENPQEYQSITLERIFYINGNHEYNTPRKYITSGKTYFVFTVQGEGLICFDQKTFLTDTNTCMFIEPSRDFSYHCKNDCWKFWWFEFTGPHPAPTNQLVSVMPNALHSMLMNECLKYTKFGDWELASSIFSTLMLLLSRSFNRSLRSFQTENAVQNMEQYIRDHISTVTVQDLSEEFHTQDRTLRNSFQKTFGLSPKQFIMKIRLEVVSHLLLNTRHSLTQIALETGFANQYHLSKAFKQYFGIPPIQYRKYIVKWE